MDDYGWGEARGGWILGEWWFRVLGEWWFRVLGVWWFRVLGVWILGGGGVEEEGEVVEGVLL